MKKIDTFLLNKFQKIADFIQDWTGLHNFAVTYVLIGIWFIFRSLGIYLDKSILVAVFSAIFLLWMVYNNNFGFKLWKKNPTFSNVFISTLFIPRTVFRYVFIFVLLGLLGNLYKIFFQKPDDVVKLLANIFYKMSACLEFLILYFMSCTPKPPSQSKISKKILVFKSIVSELGSRLSPRPQFG